MVSLPSLFVCRTDAFGVSLAARALKLVSMHASVFQGDYEDTLYVGSTLLVYGLLFAEQAKYDEGSRSGSFY